jgi:hypothetical protein
MRARGNSRQPELYGVTPIAVSRYFALYIAQIGWLALGAFLLANAYWPSTCRPDTLFKLATCSARLPENHGWIETVLMTWLWTTPILIVMEVLRRVQKHERR